MSWTAIRPGTSESWPIVGLVLTLLATGALAQIPEYLELPGVQSTFWPGDCTVWHEVAPTFCEPHHQQQHHDADGDNRISPCDFINLDGLWYHVVWVGPVLHGNYPGFPDESQVPTLPTPDPSPVCEFWHEIRGPNQCGEFHVTSWNDANGSNTLDECDIIEFEDQPGVPWHVNEMNVAIRLEPGDPELGCIVPDNGNGTADFPPACPNGYLGHLSIVDGLIDATIEIDAKLFDFQNLVQGPGGNLGGDLQTWDAALEMSMMGTGNLAGFQRLITMPVLGETHTGPRNPGDQVQSFPTEMVQLQGEIFGDPDFDVLRIEAGDNFGLPSPGHTTLTELPEGDFVVDSFFDIAYRIDFQGAPGSVLENLGGPTQGTDRFQAGEPSGPPVGQYLEIPGATSTAWPGECTVWHEVAPVWCNPYHQGDHRDSDGDGNLSPCDYIQLDGVWFHIVWVGPVIHGSDDAGGEGSQVPTEPTPFPSPVCEIWHEIRGPDVCGEFHVTDWNDSNGSNTLDECDYVEFEDQPGVPWHIDEMNVAIRIEPGEPPPPMNPEYLELPGAQSLNWPGECTVWHEVAPVWCNLYHQVNNVDTDGDGQISPCDYIQLEGEWYHIEWVGPVLHGNDGAGGDESQVPTQPTPDESPVCEYWHEIRGPNVCGEFHVTGWRDTNESETLDECDFVEFEDQPGVQWHIDEMNVAIRVTPGEPPQEVPEVIELPGWGSLLWPGDCTVWHEVAPTWCVPWHQSSHTDSDGDGEISPCDYIELNGDCFHVEWVGPVLHGNYPGEPEESHTPTQPTPDDSPVCEFWHEIRGPQVCGMFHVIDWIDANGNEVLDECDFVVFEDRPTELWHVNSLEVAVQLGPCPTGLHNEVPTFDGPGKLTAITPNPFNPTTEISFSVRDAGAVKVEIFDLRGSLVRSLVDRNLAAGEHTVTWDGKNVAGSRVSSGTYFARLQIGSEVIEVRKMSLVK